MDPLLNPFKDKFKKSGMKKHSSMSKSEIVKMFKVKSPPWSIICGRRSRESILTTSQSLNFAKKFKLKEKSYKDQLNNTG